MKGFNAERDPYGNPWAPLAKSTIEIKRAEGSSTPEAILQDTGLMMRSFEYRVLVNGVRLFNNRVFDDGTSSSIHQEGGIHPRSRSFIPQRQMLPLQGDFPPSWMIHVNDALGEGIDRIFR